VLSVMKICAPPFIDFILISVNVSKWGIIVNKKYKLLKDHVDDNLEDHDMAMSSNSTVSLFMMW
jgi:hypothetical protein